MHITTRKYDPLKDYEKLLKVIESEGEEWKEYQKAGYRESLEQSLTYVAYADEKLCGYSRSINDFGFCTWVIDLLVHKKYRGNSIGRKLMECIAVDLPGQDIYVMSGVDEYYEKLGYRKEGTIFKIE